MSSAPHPSPAWIFSGKAQCKLLQQLVSYLNKNLHYEVHYRRYRYRRNKKNESSSVCLEICQALKNIQLCGIHQFTIHNYTIQQCTVHVYINYISFFACHYSCINYIYIYIYIYIPLHGIYRLMMGNTVYIAKYSMKQISQKLC